MGRNRVLRIDSLEQFQAIQVLSDPGHIGGKLQIPNCIQVVLNWALPGARTGHNVLYGRSSGVPNPSVAMAQALFSAMTTGAAWTAYATHIATTASLSSVTVMSVHTVDQPIFQSTGAAVPGTNATTPLPIENSVVTTLRTALRGQSNRGRIYGCGYGVDQVIGGNIISASLMTDQAAWNNGFIAIFAGQSLTWVIGQPARAAYTGITGTDHPARAATSVPITAAIVRDNHWDSQRRRGLK
jgi:hypothetical protein